MHALGVQKSLCELQDTQLEDYNAFLITVPGVGPVFQGSQAERCPVYDSNTIAQDHV